MPPAIRQHSHSSAMLLCCSRLLHWTALMVAAHDLQVFSKVGDVKRIVMGLDKQQLTPCGFCFVVYYTRADTEDCVKYVYPVEYDAVCSSVMQPAC